MIMENNQNAVTQTDEKIGENVDTQATKNKDEAKPAEKTFSQAEFNKFEKDLKAKYKEKYKGYDEWLESQKTEVEKQKELTQKMADTENENVTLKKENQVLKSGVSVDDADYVVFKVSKMEGDFEENLGNFLKENPKYLRVKEPVETPQNTDGVAVNKNNNNSQESGVMAILKEKHPEAF